MYVHITYYFATDCNELSFNFGTLLKYKLWTEAKFTESSPGKARTQTCVLQGEWATVVLNLPFQSADHGFEAASESGRSGIDAQLQTLKQQQ